MEQKQVNYHIIRSNRRTISIQIKPDGEVVVRCPNRMRTEMIQNFVSSKANWIDQHLQKIASTVQQPAFTAEELHTLKNLAEQIIPERVVYFAKALGVDYGRITVRAQRSRWGSCSSKGNLNFNCLLALAPKEVVDYIVVHELCHRKQMNHSAQFWKEVERVLPDYRFRQKWLKEEGSVLINRLG